MTGMLASVNSLEEAILVANTAVDIIDLKQPEKGALGALPIDTVKHIVNQLDHQKPISATIGDLPMQPELIYNAVNAMSKTGVDYIKIGFFPEGNWQQTLQKLAPLCTQGKQLIAVLFADTQPDLNTISTFKDQGFQGIMLDTMDKSLGSLLQVMPLTQIKKFVSIANESQLLCGLAGSLKKQDIPALLPLNTDYLGFRGALCEKHKRTAQINEDAITSILNSFPPQS